jgi:hypothetical protein
MPVLCRQVRIADPEPDEGVVLEENGNEALLQVEGQSARIKFVPGLDDDFDQVIAVINRLIARTACFRRFRS